MPIKLGMQMEPVSHDDFHALDYQIMAIVFSIHNDMGRFWSEKIYKKELAYRCQKSGVGDAAIEVPIEVSFESFVKFYYIDLLINNVIYEMKTVETLTGEHEKQAINYLMLTGLNHAKLINMRPPSVQHRFVSTKITPSKRYDFTIDDEQWRDLDEESIWLKQMFKRFLDEWGVFLEVNLFYEAIVHFLGGEENVIKEIEVMDGTRFLERQKTHLLNSNIAFKITSTTKDEGHYETHFRRFLRYTSLKAMHWINFNHDNVVFKTLLK